MFGKICFIIYLFITHFIQIQAQFGVNKPKKDEIQNPIQNSDPDGMGSTLDFDDPELQAAIELFAAMSPEEMTRTIEELKDMLGDDPEILREIDEIMAEIAKMDAGELQQNMKDLLDDEMVNMAMDDTLELLQNAGESDWEKVLDNKDAILEAVISTGAMSDEEIAIYRAEPDSWEEELRLIWDELKQQAEDSVHSEL
jgi:hypothetical protein